MSEKLKGMRTLSDNEIEIMNAIADHGNDLEYFITRMEKSGMGFDTRWLEEGKIHLQIGIMCLKRAVGKPENF